MQALIYYLILFDLILYVPSTIFQLQRDGSSWDEPVLSKDTCVLLKDHNAVTPVRLEPATPRSRVKHSTTEPLGSLLDILWHFIWVFTDCQSLQVPVSRMKMVMTFPFKKVKIQMLLVYAL